ncbi:nucleotidyltransferase [Microbispora rosea subsp. aerata]|nr:sugar phosphate nucleotidyltransferase [Microbispora rosea]GGO27220.1 nucleotidyltransferase [Microbispora rosea subsp. aerata]GIH57611.1 nucleotidyltransferase [Microbispora rosea subsp. aerata]GLJ86789.1 nucleotidyltransferase [Microbispora rosea subsp. aerata]
MTSTDYIGLVPAAGRGTRLAPLRYPKELLPIVYEPADGGSRLRPVAEHALESVARAGAGRAIVVVAPWKLEVVSYLGDGSHLGLDLAYLFQEQARGLAHALDLAREWTRGGNVMFVMPDTIFTPSDALTRLRDTYEETGADLALAVFPTPDAHRLGPVVLYGDRRQWVRRVFDKPAEPPVMNTWGAAIWGDAFADLLHEGLRRDDAAEPVIGHYFDLAVRNGLKVAAVPFDDGSFQDVGTPLGVRRSLEGPTLLAVRS